MENLAPPMGPSWLVSRGTSARSESSHSATDRRNTRYIQDLIKSDMFMNQQKVTVSGVNGENRMSWRNIGVSANLEMSFLILHSVATTYVRLTTRARDILDKCHVSAIIILTLNILYFQRPTTWRD